MIIQRVVPAVVVFLCGCTFHGALRAQGQGAANPHSPSVHVDELLPATVWTDSDKGRPQIRNGVAARLPRAAVEAFVKVVVSDEANVCDFQFKDLTSSGMNQLIVSIDYSGRSFCNTVAVIVKNGTEFREQHLFAWEVNDVSAIVRDLRGDGALELLTPQAISDYEGSRCVATWRRVYELTGAGVLLDISDKFPGLYSDRLHELAGEIQALRSDNGSGAEDRLACDSVESDKISRFLGVDPKAGLDRALEWMKSPDPSLRRKAVREFRDIGDSVSLRALGVLSQDPDPSVASAARRKQTR